MRLLAAVLIALAVPGASLAADDPRTQFNSAVALAKAGKHAEALPLLDAVVKALPKSPKARLVRGKVRFRLAKFDEALEDAEQVFREAPATPGAKEFLEQARSKVKPIVVTVVGGKSKYSEWIWSWTLPGDKTFAFADFKGAEGSTLFYWPATPPDQAEVDKLEADAQENYFFLRIVKATLEQSAAKDRGVKALPYMVLIDEAGAEAARGAPAEVAPKLEAIRKVKRDAKLANDPIVKLDFHDSFRPPTELGRSGFTTIVMLSSPACHTCRDEKPKVEQLPTTQTKTRLVIGDVGVDANGGINWGAPVVNAWGVKCLPWYVIVDPSGAIKSSGPAAQDAVHAMFPQ